MAEQEQIRFDLSRQPWAHADVRDERALRDWLLSNVAARVVLAGKLVPTFHFFGDGFIEAGEPPRGDDPFAEPLIAQLFFMASARPEVLRRVRVGEVNVPVDGVRRRHVAVVEIARDGTVEDKAGMRWWAAWRRIGTAADAGVLLGAWEEQEGQGLANLVEPLQDWFDAGHSEVETFGMEVKPSAAEGPAIKWTHGQIRVALSEDLLPAATQLLQLVAPALLSRTLKIPLILAARGLELDRFELHSETSVPMDDIVRGVVNEVQAVTAALVLPAVFEIDGDHRPGWVMVVEQGGRRCQVGIPKPRPGDTSGESKAFLNELGAVGDDGWIGVEPRVGLEIPGLFRTGVAEA